MVGRRRSSRICALQVVPNPGAAGRHESGRCRSSRIRALPVVPLPATTGKASWRLERSTDRETAISGGRARRQPSCRRDDRFLERKLRDEHWQRELELGWALPVDPNRALPVVWNPGGADRPESGRCRSSRTRAHCRSSRMRALPVVPLSATTGKASWSLVTGALTESTAIGRRGRLPVVIPVAGALTDFGVPRVPGEHWERESSLESGRCRWSRLPATTRKVTSTRLDRRTDRVDGEQVAPTARPASGRSRSDDRFWERKATGRTLGTRVGAWTGALTESSANPWR